MTASPGVRVEQLGETIEIVRALWAQAPATYHGKHYQIDQAYCTPRPEQVPPILVGTDDKKALAVTARLADAWNYDYRMETFAPAYRVLKQQCEEIGRDFGELRLTACGTAHFPRDTMEFVPADPIKEEPKLGRTPAQAVAQLRPFVELGVSHFQIGFADQRTIEPFCEGVALRVAQL